MITCMGCYSYSEQESEYYVVLISVYPPFYLGPGRREVLVELSPAGHCPHHEAPGSFNAITANWIRSRANANDQEQFRSEERTNANGDDQSTSEALSLLPCGQATNEMDRELSSKGRANANDENRSSSEALLLLQRGQANNEIEMDSVNSKEGPLTTGPQSAADSGPVVEGLSRLSTDRELSSADLLLGSEGHAPVVAGAPVVSARVVAEEDAGVSFLDGLLTRLVR